MHEHPRLEIVALILFITFALIFWASVLFAPKLMGKAELLLGEILFILPALVYTTRAGYPVHAVYRLRPVSRKVILVSLLLGLSVPVLVDELDRLVELVFPMPEQFLKSIEELMRPRNVKDWVILLGSAVLVAGLVEEMLFRGLLLQALEHRFSGAVSVLIASFVFALFHLNPWWTLQIILLGFLLGVMAWKSDSIVPGAILHGMNNGLAIFFVNAKESHYSWYLSKGHVAPGILALMAIVTYFGLRLFWRYCEEETRKIGGEMTRVEKAAGEERF